MGSNGTPVRRTPAHFAVPLIRVAASLDVYLVPDHILICLCTRYDRHSVLFPSHRNSARRSLVGAYGSSHVHPTMPVAWDRDAETVGVRLFPLVRLIEAALLGYRLPEVLIPVSAPSLQASMESSRCRCLPSSSRCNVNSSVDGLDRFSSIHCQEWENFARRLNMLKHTRTFVLHSGIVICRAAAHCLFKRISFEVPTNSSQEIQIDRTAVPHVLDRRDTSRWRCPPVTMDTSPRITWRGSLDRMNVLAGRT